jgi:SOS-response transcriptional repressor LexA
MRRKGVGPTELARKIKSSKQNVGRWAKQTRALPPDMANRAAPILDTTAAELLLVDGQRSSKQEARRQRRPSIPLLGQVTAGELKEPSTQFPPEDAIKGLGAGDFFAVRLEKDADSMDRLSPPGSILIVNGADRELRNGACYIFSLNGETTYKMWQEGDPAYLAPYSTNPAHKPKIIKRKRDFEVIGRVKRTVLDL